MKRLLWLCLLFACPLHGAIAWVSASHTVCPQTTASVGVVCTMTAASTLGNTVVVSISMKTPRVMSGAALVGSNAAAYFMQITPAFANGTSEAAVIQVCFNCPALTTVTPTFNATTIYELEVDEYSGVGAIGAWVSNSGTSAAPNTTLVTNDNNNWVVSVSASIGSNGIPTAGTGCGTTTGNLRGAGRTANATTGAAIGVCDNTLASAGSLSITDTITSSAWATVGVELRSASTAPPCTSPCPNFANYTQWGSNDGSSILPTSYRYTLPQTQINGGVLTTGTGSSNLLVAFVMAGGGAVAGFNNISGITVGGNAMTSGVTCNDGGTSPAKEVGIFYLPNVAAGLQSVVLTLNTATNADDVQILMVELYNVATSTPIDGTPTCSANQSSPAQAGSITTVADGDIVLMFGNDDGLYSTGQTNYVSAFSPATALKTGGINLTMLGDTRRFGPFAFYINQATHGAINPAMYIDQASTTTWNVAAIAFKSASAGTAPAGMYIKREIVEIPSATTYRIDSPCSGNLSVALGSTTPTQAKITGITDASGNTYTWLGALTNSPQILYVANSTCTNSNYRQATVTMSSVLTVDPIHFYDIVGAATSPLDTGVTTSTSGATSASGLLNSGDGGTQNQGFPNTSKYSASSVTCVSSINTDTLFTFTPSIANGIAFVAENNGQGPECGVSGSTSGAILDSVWAPGEDDTQFGTLDSSSGYGHIGYSSTSAITWKFNWANCLSDPGGTTGCATGTNTQSSPGSGYSMSIAAFKAPAGAAPVSAPKLLMMNVGAQ